MLQFLGGVLQKLLGGDTGLDPAGHVVVAFVAQGADPLGGQRLVEQTQNLLPVGVVTLGHGALLDMLTSAFTQGFHIGQCNGVHAHLPADRLYRVGTAARVGSSIAIATEVPVGWADCPRNGECSHGPNACHALSTGTGAGHARLRPPAAVSLLVRHRLGLAPGRGQGLCHSGVATQCHGGAWRAVVADHRRHPPTHRCRQGQPARPQPGCADGTLCGGQAPGVGGVGDFDRRAQSRLGAGGLPA
ncbi:hypothetical protein D3C80_1222230 [compost metagenome]